MARKTMLTNFRFRLTNFRFLLKTLKNLLKVVKVKSWIVVPKEDLDEASVIAVKIILLHPN